MPRQDRLDARPACPDLGVLAWARDGGQAPGTLHHVIVRGIEKKEIVTDNTDRKNFITRLGTLVTDTDMEVYAWALMTNHAHILIRKCSVSYCN